MVMVTPAAAMEVMEEAEVVAGEEWILLNPETGGGGGGSRPFTRSSFSCSCSSSPAPRPHSLRHSATPEMTRGACGR